MGLPQTKITFVSPVTRGVTRAERGVCAIVVMDDTGSFSYKTYTSLSEVSATDYTAANYADIARAFLASPYKVIVVRIDTEDTIADATAILDNLGYDWVCSNASSLQSGLVTYVKGINTNYRARKVKCIATGASAADDEHIVHAENSTVTIKGAVTTTAMLNYLPRLAGVLAACPLDRSVTAWELSDLSAVAEVANIDTAINAGKFCLHKDDNVIRIARGVNTLQTIGTGKIASMKKIAVVEGMDLTRQEIIGEFKTNYLGKVKNDSDHQALFVSDVISILNTLANESVLDDASGMTVEIDVAAMRTAWANAGVDVTGLTDAEVKNKTYGSTIFVVCRNMRFLDAMEDLDMEIQLD